MQAEFYGIGDYNRLAGVETLEYKSAVYDQDGSLQFDINIGADLDDTVFLPNRQVAECRSAWLRWGCA